MFNFFKKRKASALDGHSCPPDLTPEQDIAIAEEAVRDGDLKHAAFHVGCALAADGERPEWLALLDRIADIAPDPLQIAPLEERGFYATVAVRAYVLHRLNRLEEALGLLFQAMQAKPGAPYLAWACAWMTDAPRGVSDLGGLKQYLAHLRAVLDEGQARPQDFPCLQKWLLPLADAALALLPDDSTLCLILVGSLRRFGHIDEAFRIARDGYAAHPDYNGAIALASALRQRNDYDGAIATYRDSLRWQPEDLGARLDAGDLLYQKGDLAEAEAVYREVTDREKGHPWAVPSLLALRYEREAVDDALKSLQQFAERGNERARELLSRRTPYFGAELLYPSEASINAVEQMLASRKEQEAASRTGEMATVTMTVSGLEAPSAYLAINRELEPLGMRLSVSASQIQKPDPRLPRGGGPVAYQLWRYEGQEAAPNMPPPSPEVAEAVAELACRPYARDAWTIGARTIGKHLGPDAIPDLLGAMIHPPDLPLNKEHDLRWWQWLYRVQIAATLILAFVDTGWEGSSRRAALLSLANGPMDWTVDAACLSLAVLALDGEASENEVARTLRGLLQNPPRPGHVCYEPVALLGLMYLPSTLAEERTKCGEQFRALFA